MINIKRIHHIAIISGDYNTSKQFYTEVLGFTIIKETYRKERQSYKLDLAVDGTYQIELFSFPESRDRASMPEAKGLRHLAFSVADVAATVAYLRSKNVDVQDVRIDEITGKKFSFFYDPDMQPLEVYEEK